MTELKNDRVDKFIKDRNTAAAAKPNPLREPSNVDLNKLGGITIAPSSPQLEKTK